MPGYVYAYIYTWGHLYEDGAKQQLQGSYITTRILAIVSNIVILLVNILPGIYIRLITLLARLMAHTST